jgi:hypothetical protein
MMKTPFVYTTEMSDPVSRWKFVEECIIKGDPLVLYTKAPVPLNILTLKQTNFAIAYTITGWGGSWLEPKVPEPGVMIKHFNGSAQMLGDRVSLRIDPVVPTEMGFIKALNVAVQVQKPVKIITSILQLYSGHETMAKRLNINLEDYTVQSGRAKFVKPSIAQGWIDKLNLTTHWSEGRVQMCGMPYGIKGSVHTGCVDEALLKAIGVTNYDKVAPGRQRPGCKCVIAKKQLMMGSCPHNCCYCYAHKENLRHVPAN